MARPLRYEAAGALYHIMARGEGGKDVFEDDADRHSWLKRLGQACEKHGWKVHAWVLMGNHFHLLLETPKPNLVTGMKWLMGVFSQGWNIRRKRRGHVFQGRYKAVVVNGEGSGEYFRIVADYIHLNPVRSAWVGGTTRRKLASWKWSSFLQYAGGRGFPWMETAKVLEAFRLDQGARGQRAYALYLEGRAKDQDGALNDESLDALRQGWYLGEDGFRDRILNALSKKAKKLSKRSNLGGPAARSYDEAEARRLIEAIAVSLGIDSSPKTLEGRGRLLNEKALLAWVLKTHTGVSNQWISDHIRTGHPSGVSKAVKRVSDDAKMLRKAKRLVKIALSRDESE